MSLVVRKPVFGCPTRSDTKPAVQSVKMVRGLKFWIQKVEGWSIRVPKTKALISFVVTAKLICVFVFVYTRIRFSHDAAHVDKVGHKQICQPYNRARGLKFHI